MEVRPCPLDRGADHAPSDLAEPAAVEIPEIDDIRGHRGSLARAALPPNPPAGSTARSLALSAAECYFLPDQFSREPGDGFRPCAVIHPLFEGAGPARPRLRSPPLRVAVGPPALAHTYRAQD